MIVGRNPLHFHRYAGRYRAQYWCGERPVTVDSRTKIEHRAPMRLDFIAGWPAPRLRAYPLESTKRQIVFAVSDFPLLRGPSLLESDDSKVDVLCHLLIPDTEFTQHHLVIFSIPEEHGTTRLRLLCGKDAYYWEVRV